VARRSSGEVVRQKARQRWNDGTVTSDAIRRFCLYVTGGRIALSNLDNIGSGENRYSQNEGIEARATDALSAHLLRANFGRFVRFLLGDALRASGGARIERQLHGAVPTAVGEINHQADRQPTEKNFPGEQMQRKHHD